MVGRNLSINDSFTLKFINNTSSDFTFNLFNQGGSGSGYATPIRTGILSTTNGQNVITLVNSVFSAATTMEIRDSTSTLISSVIMPLGSTLNNYLATVNPLTDSLGNLGVLFGQPTPNDITGTLYDFVLTGFEANSFKFATLTYVPAIQNTSYVITNPFLTIQGVVPITIIQQSETGNAYRVMGVDIISDNPNQLLQEITYGNREADGNIWTSGFTPTIDPYQENNISLHGIGGSGSTAPNDDFTINTDTTFQYTVLSTSFCRMTFNYVKGSLSFMREFNQALATELSMKFAQQKQYLDSLKYRRGVFLQ